MLTFKLRGKIYEKAKGMDLSCYDDPEFYNDFVLSTTQTDQCVERFMNDGRDFVSTLTICVLYFSYLLVMDKTGLLLALFGSFFNLWAGKAYFRLQEKARREKLPFERQRDYQHRVFYLHDYAKELRLHPEMKGLLLQDFDRCNETVNGINKKYGFKLDRKSVV